MRFSFKIITALLLIFSNGNVQARSITAPEQVKTQLDELVTLDENLAKIPVGIVIRDLINKRDIYSHNPETLFVPASNIKIYTTLLALEKLGRDFRYATTLTTDGQVISSGNSRTINGNLYINFSGDPVFTHEQLRQLFQVMVQNNIRKIAGNIIINRYGFDNTAYGPGWMWDDFNDCYSAPADIITLDENCIRVSVLAGGENDFIIRTPNSVSFDNTGVKISETGIPALELNYDFSYNNKISLTGEVIRNLPAETEKSIINPLTYTSNVIKSIIQESFILTGTIITDSVPAEKHLMLARNYSPTLEELLKRFNKESHNLIGEMLLKTIARKETGTGSTAAGAKIMREFLEKSFNTERFRIVDGSGLSRYNLVTPDLTIKLLESIYDDSSDRSVVLEAFPIGGAEGTLQNRLKNLTDFKVIAKSGSMTGVNCLSGYLVNNRGVVAAFSIMMNNTVLGGKILRDYQDRILKIVAESIRNNNPEL